jgi:hypothetical protein
VQYRVPLRGRMAVDLIAEGFNIFNRRNWGIETQESARDVGQRTSAQFRTAQLGFRMTF